MDSFGQRHEPCAVMPVVFVLIKVGFSLSWTPYSLWSFARLQAALQGSPGRHCLSHMFSVPEFFGSFPLAHLLLLAMYVERRAARETTLERPSRAFGLLVDTPLVLQFCVTGTPTWLLLSRHRDRSVFHLDMPSDS